MIVLFFLELSIHIFWWLFFEFLKVRTISILFLFSCHCESAVSLSAVIVNKKKFGPNFSDATFLPVLLQKRSDMFMLFLLGLRAIQIKFKTVHQSIFLENSREKLTIIAL